MEKCLWCSEDGVVFDADFDNTDFNDSEQYVLRIAHCTNCGAEITYMIPEK